jgi:predicted P-loop ATPase
MLERDAIWSAAVAAYKAGEPNHLPRGMAAAVDAENESYLVTNPWLSAVETYLTRRVSVEPLTSEEILINAIQKPVERQTRGDQMQVSSILKNLGWVKFREPKGQRRWIYKRI